MIYDKVKKLLKENKLDDAYNLAYNAYKHTPDSSNANMALAIVMVAKENKEQAFSLLYNAIKLNPSNALAFANRAIINYRDKHYYEAMIDAEKALDLDPNLDEIRRMLTKIYFYYEKYEDAINCFEPYIKKFYKDINNYILLGEIYAFNGNYDKSLQVYQQALKITDDALIYFYIGAVYFMANDLTNADKNFKYAKNKNSNIENIINYIITYAKKEKELTRALTFAKAVLRMNPKSYQPYIIIAEILSEKGKGNEAENYFKKILSLNPNLPQVRSRYASLLLSLGKKEQAQMELKRSFVGNGEDVYVYNMLAPLIDWTPDHPYIKDMQTLLNSDKLTNKEKEVLNFALATVYEKLKEYALSFNYLKTGNQLARSSIKNRDINIFIKQMEVLKKVFTKDFLSQNLPNQPKEKGPIFIVGTPRSGSTLVETILSCHSQVYSAGEISALNDSLSKYFFADPNRPFPHNLDEEKIKYFSIAGHEYMNYMKELAKEKKFFTDKNLFNFKWIGFIKLMLPNAKIIHTKRDPLDSCLSMYKQNFKSDSLYFTFDLKELGLFYKHYVDIMNHWKTVLPDFIYDISYEKLVENQEEETRKLLEFCGLEWEDSCLQFYKSSREVYTASRVQVRKPLYKSSVKKWKYYEKELQPVIKILKESGII